MADKGRTQLGISPKDLLVRSNPGLFANIRDITNPRDMYHLVTDRKWPKQSAEDSWRYEMPSLSNTFPMIARSGSMKDLYKPKSKIPRLTHHFSNAELYRRERGDMPNSLIVRQSSSLEELQDDHKDEMEKENLKTLNLPNLNEDKTKSQSTRLNESDNDLKFPKITSGQPNVDQRSMADERRVHRQARHRGHPDQHNIEKWFSEMPNEVFDKAQRALMEESIRDRLQAYQAERQRTIHAFSRRKVPNLKPLKSIPNQYLELRTRGPAKRQKDFEAERLDREQYKMKQKSLLKLKLVDFEDKEKQERHAIDLNPRNCFSPQRPIALNGKQTYRHYRNDHKEEVSPSLTLEAVTYSPTTKFLLARLEDDGDQIYNHPTPIDRDSSYRPPVSTAQRQQPIYEPKDNLETYQKDGLPDETVKDSTKATIVNIVMDKETPKKKNPTYIHQPISRRFSDKSDKSAENDTWGKDIKHSGDSKGTDGSTTDDVTEGSGEGTISPSSSQQQAKKPKSVLRKFNKLEVFAEYKPKEDGDPPDVPDNTAQVDESKKPIFGKVNHPLYKLDLRTHKPPIEPVPETEIEERIEEDEGPMISFRFHPGEVVVTRRGNNSYQNGGQWNGERFSNHVMADTIQEEPSVLSNSPEEFHSHRTSKSTEPSEKLIVIGEHAQTFYRKPVTERLQENLEHSEEQKHESSGLHTTNLGETAHKKPNPNKMESNETFNQITNAQEAKQNDVTIAKNDSFEAKPSEDLPRSEMLDDKSQSPGQIPNEAGEEPAFVSEVIGELNSQDNTDFREEYTERQNCEGNDDVLIDSVDGRGERQPVDSRGHSPPSDIELSNNESNSRRPPSATFSEDGSNSESEVDLATMS